MDGHLKLFVMDGFLFLQRPISTRLHRSSATETDGSVNTPCHRLSFSSNQDFPMNDRSVSEEFLLKEYANNLFTDTWKP